MTLNEAVIARHSVRKDINKAIEPEIVKELQNIKWWNLPEDILKENISLFQKDEIQVSDLEQLKRCVRG